MLRLLIAWSIILLLLGVQPARAAVPYQGGSVQTPLQGKLEVLVADDFKHQVAHTSYFLDTPDGKRYALQFDGPPPTVRPGSIVRVQGERSGGSLRLRTTRAPEFTVITAATPVPTGPKKVAVLTFNFASDQRQPTSADDLRKVIFTNTDSVNAYYGENSYGKTSLIGAVRSDGDIYGPYTIADNPSTCDTNTFQQQADAAATAAGVNLKSYDNIIYYFPTLQACTFGGLGQVGAGRSWINGYPDTYIFAHELGHNFGASHASSYRCVNAKGQSVPISTNCTPDEYGDPFDVMGSGGAVQMNSVHKGDANFLVSANTQSVTSSGTYTINSLEQASTGVQTLRIPWGKDSLGFQRYYYLDYRQPYGTFDTFAPTDPIVNGVAIRLAAAYDTYANSWLIDTTPATDTFADAPLAVGKTFWDLAAGVTIHTDSISSSSATVDVTLGPITCQRASPTFSMTPAQQAGYPGQGRSYTVNITNNDNPGCADSTYGVTASLPAGWSQTVTPAPITLSPGAATTASVTVTPVTTAGAGVNSFTESLSVASVTVASATASYAVGSILRVTSTDDTDQCPNGPGNAGYTLRCAINQANTDGGGDGIFFAIAPGSGNTCAATQIDGSTKTVCTITPADCLPYLTAPDTTVDGYTQTDASPNTLAAGSGDNAVLTIQLDGQQLGCVGGLVLYGERDLARGLSVTNFGTFGLAFSSNDSVLAGNFLGVAPDGSSGGNGQAGVGTTWNGAYSQGDTIGGLTPADANVLSDNTTAGLDLEFSNYNTIQGNYIGTNPMGAATAPNGGEGIKLYASGGNEIGGSQQGATNVISGNVGAGIDTGGYSYSNRIEGNDIGVSGAGANLGNTIGIYFHDNTGQNSIGDITPGAGNVIADNIQQGVLVGSSDTNGVTVQVRGNSIYGNGALGLDLAPAGTIDCSDPSNAAPNQHLVCPIITSATLARVTGNTCDLCVVDIYTAVAGNPDQGHGEGKSYIGSTTANSSGSWSYAVSPGILATTQAVTATANVVYGGTYPWGLTSEFGANVQVTNPQPGKPKVTSVTPGSHSVTISWAAPADDGGSPITGYDVSCDPGAVKASPQPGPNDRQATVNNLVNGTQYTCYVSAITAYASRQSDPITVTPSGKPGAPTVSSPSQSPGAIALTWTAADPNGSPVTSYTATCARASNGSGSQSATVDGNTLKATVSGLTNGIVYACSVAASNANGPGTASTPVTVNLNQPPTITFSASTPTVAYGAPLSITVTATDVDANDALTRRSITGLPTGLKASAASTGQSPLIFTITGSGPGNAVAAQPGIYPITVTVNDGVNPDVSQIVTITVTKQQVTLIPIIGKAGTDPVAPITVPSASSTTGALTFSATIKEIWLGAAGKAIDAGTPFSITLSRVVTNGVGAVPVPGSCITTGSSSPLGTASSITGSCLVAHVPVGVYDIHLAIASTSSYFQGSYDLVLTVAAGFKEYGGGTLVRPVNAKLLYPAGFGFLASPCTTTGSVSPQGGFVYVEHRPTGDVVVMGGSGSLTSCKLSGGGSSKTAVLRGSVTRSDGVGPFSATLTAVGGTTAKLGLVVTDSGGHTTHVHFTPVVATVGSKIVTG